MDNPYHDIEQENIKRLVSEREQLRKQNAVLREALEKAVRAMEWYAWHKEEDHDCMEYRAVTAARAALAATEKKP